MKRNKIIILLLIFLVGIGVFYVSHVRRPILLDHGWTPPVKIADSQNDLDGSVDLYKWRDTIILLQSRYDWSSKSSTCSIMTRNNNPPNSWYQQPLSDIPRGYRFYTPAIDAANDNILFAQSYTENDQLMMSTIFAHMMENGHTQVGTERKWTTDKKSLLGETPPNVHINEPGKRGWGLLLGFGILNGADIYISYCLSGRAYRENSTEDGPFNNGIFHSTDSGKTWQIERISDFDSFDSTVCRTKGHYYYFATGLIGIRHGHPLWFSRKSVGDNSWDQPKELKRTIPNGVDARYIATTEDDTVHLFWLDSRHTKWRFTLEGPIFEDCEVAYCHWKDADAGWSKDVILSKGVRSSYAPSISVEGDKIVAAWSGNQTARACPWECDPNDIYYATSKDGGKTWAKPLQVTDVAKDGITVGRTQVALHSGVIHLFYVQGKWDQNLQVGNQGSWPIYYQQHPFPN